MRTYPTTFQVVFFMKGNVVQELLKFISVECQAKLGESLHWARNEQRLSIEQAAAKAQCRIQDIDDLETGRKAIDLKLLCRLLKLYGEKLVIYLEGYEDE